ncbi:unnamed protein product [Musa hybrid cultivar]
MSPFHHPFSMGRDFCSLWIWPLHFGAKLKQGFTHRLWTPWKQDPSCMRQTLHESEQLTMCPPPELDFNSCVDTTNTTGWTPWLTCNFQGKDNKSKHCNKQEKKSSKGRRVVKESTNEHQ